MDECGERAESSVMDRALTQQAEGINTLGMMSSCSGTPGGNRQPHLDILLSSTVRGRALILVIC